MLTPYTRVHETRILPYMSTKSLRVSGETHGALMRFVEGSGFGPVSVDHVLAQLLAPTTLHIALSNVQRQRWDRAAAEAGMDTPAFVRARVEAALQFGADPAVMGTVYKTVVNTHAAIKELMGDRAKASGRHRTKKEGTEGDTTDGTSGPTG